MPATKRIINRAEEPAGEAAVGAGAPPLMTPIPHQNPVAAGERAGEIEPAVRVRSEQRPVRRWIRSAVIAFALGEGVAAVELPGAAEPLVHPYLQGAIVAPGLR